MQNLLNSDQIDTLKMLDLHYILEELSKHAHFEKNKIKFIPPIGISNIDEISKEYDLIDNLNFHIVSETQYKIHQLIRTISPNIHFSQLINHIDKQGYLGVDQTHQMAKLIEVAHQVLQLDKASTLFVNSTFKLKWKEIYKSFLLPIRQIILEDGSISYTGHPRLKSIFDEIQSQSDFIKNELKKVLKDLSITESIRNTNTDQIFGRYVIFVRSDRYKSSIGHIVHRSDSGKTLLVEPHQIHEASNKIRYLESELEYEVELLIRDIFNTVKIYTHDFFDAHQSILNYDYFLTKIYFHFKHKLTRPILIPRPCSKFTNLTHPLIDNCIANSIFYEEDKKTIIISGPNTGGKTVLIKSFLLAHIMCHLKLFVSSEKAEIYPFKGIFYYGADSQSLSEGLSSFSSEVKNYLNLFKEFEDSNLIGIDEIFNSTTSDEASALAMGLFESIHKQSLSYLLVSTHHKTLKIHTHTDKRFISAHMSFNPETFTPTYKLVLGSPGSSLALQIFEKFAADFPQKNLVLITAKQFLSESSTTYESLLHELSAKISNADKVLLENKKIEKDLINRSHAFEQELTKQKSEILKKHKDKIDKLQQDLLNIKNKYKDLDINSRQEINSTINKVHEILPSTFIENHDEDNQLVQITINEFYFSKLFKRNVKVLEIFEKKKSALCQVDHKKIHLPLTDLSLAKGKSKTKDFTYNIITSTADASLELDCRGMRLEEFKEIVDQYLDKIRLEVVPYVSFIHGHGNGTLKEWLREYLKSNSSFMWESPKHSLDGITTVYFK